MRKGAWLQWSVEIRGQPLPVKAEPLHDSGQPLHTFFDAGCSCFSFASSLKGERYAKSKNQR